MLVNTILIFMSGLFGFFLGRFSVHRAWEDMRKEQDETEQGVENKIVRRRDKKGVKPVEKYNLGSPVAGTITGSERGEYPMMIIRPEGGRVYAPAGGRIKRIFPGSNEILFATEFGAELHISVGDIQDELLECYYRPRVVQNEVVPKGRLLLEFDGAGIASEGKTADVLLRMSAMDSNMSLELAELGRIKVGEPIVRIY